MTLAIVWLGACAAWGLLASTRLRTPFGLGPRAGLGLAFGVALSLWLPAVLALVFGLTWGTRLAFGATTALVALEAARSEAWRVLWAEARDTRGSFRRPATWILLVLLAALAVLLGHLFHLHSIRFTPEGAFSAGYSFNDMAFHATLANSFLHGENLSPPEYPPLAHHPLGYPFVPDLLAAVLVTLGSPLGFAFAASGWIATLAFVLLLFHLAKRWSGGSSLAGALAVALFLLSGGFGFVHLLARCSGGQSFWSALTGTDYTFCRDLGVDYTNMLVGAFLPSRCAGYGMMLALAILELLSRGLARDLEPRRDVAVAGALAGLVPLVHAHSVVCLALVIGPWMLTHRISPVRWLRFVGPCVLLALPQIAWILHFLAASPSEGFSHWEPGWMSGASTLGAWAGYWVMNGGVFILLVVPAWLASPFALKRLALPAFALFAVANLLRLQPWTYDNIRLLGYAHLLAAVPVARLLARLGRSSVTGAALATELVILATLTGTATIARETQLDFLLCNADAVAFANDLDAATPPRAVFLTAGVHTHPVTMLAGRRVALGYDGWLYTHGVPYADRIEPVKAIYAGAPDARQWIEKYEIDYVVVGPEERRSFPRIDERFLQEIAVESFESHGYHVYRVRKP